MLQWQTTAMIRITLSADEISLLRNYRKISPLALLRNKADAILLRSKKLPLTTIAFTQNVGYRTVQRWIKDFDKKRMASIFSGLVGNEHAAKLTRIQKAAIQQVLQQKPSVYRLSKDFWDVPQLKEYLYARFGAVYEELMPLLDDPDWEIFTSDEVGLRLEAITRKAWLKKGKRTVIKVARESTKQNYLGFLNQRDFTCQVFEIETGNQQEIIRTTTQLLGLYPNKKICLIWDNATCHKGKEVQKALVKGGVLQRVHLINLPPYAPDYNPIEKVWNSVKQKLANQQFSLFEETKQQFAQLVKNNKFYFQI